MAQGWLPQLLQHLTSPELTNSENALPRTAFGADKNMTPEPEWIRLANQGKSVIQNPDGSASTVRTISFDMGDKTYVAPTVRVLNGVPTNLTNREAVDLAIQNRDAVPFDSIDAAEQYSEDLHQDQARRNIKYTGPRQGGY